MRLLLTVCRRSHATVLSSEFGDESRGKSKGLAVRGTRIMAVKEPVRARESVAERLLAEKLITEDALQSASEEAAKGDRPLLAILVEQGALSENDKLRFLNRSLGIPVVSLRDIMPRPEVSGFISAERCMKHRLVPLRIEGGKLLAAMEDPTDIAALTALQTAASMDVKPVLASGTDINLAISRTPDLEAMEGKPRRKSSSAVQKATLLVLTFIPAMAFYIAIFLNPSKEGFIAELDGFGRVLFLIITWGSWASIAYFITDMVFGKPKR